MVVSVTVITVKLKIPPPFPAELPEIVELLSVSVPPFEMPPPLAPALAVFLETTVLVTVITPELTIPPAVARVL